MISPHIEDDNYYADNDVDAVLVNYRELMANSRISRRWMTRLSSMALLTNRQFFHDSSIFIKFDRRQFMWNVSQNWVSNPSTPNYTQNNSALNFFPLTWLKKYLIYSNKTKKSAFDKAFVYFYSNLFFCTLPFSSLIWTIFDFFYYFFFLLSVEFFVIFLQFSLFDIYPFMFIRLRQHK